MTTTADWLHLKLGLPLTDYAEAASDADSSDSTVTARQRAYAARALSVVFPGR